MQEAIDIHEHQTCFIMDNSAVHCSNDSTSYLKETKWSWFFLPQYAPELAPNELFFWQLKRLISSSRQQAIMDVEKQSGVIRLAELINPIEWVTIVKTWKHFFEKLKKQIGDMTSIFKLSYKNLNFIVSSILK